MRSTDRQPRWPTPAELARTLLSGVVPGTLNVPDGPAAPAGAGTAADLVLKVRPFTAVAGDRLWVLVDDGDRDADRLRQHVVESRQGDVPALVDLLDVPPVRTDLPRARLCLAGWVEPFPVDEQRRAAVDAATTRPVSQLLAVGHGATLYRFQAAEVSLTRSDATYDVDVDELRTVEPDPVYENEQEITGHLQQHHYDDLTCWALAHLSDEERRTLRQVTITGIDRYGLDLACVTAGGCRRSRVTFADPVPDEDALGDALRELRRCPCDPA